MPAIRPGLLTRPNTTDFELGKSSTKSLQIAFPKTPYLDGYDERDVKSAFFSPKEQKGTGMETTINDGGYAFGEIPRYYKDAPNLDEVQVGGAGKPASPYGPNIASPAEGHNPRTIPDAGVDATNAAVSPSEGAYIGNGKVSPSTTTQRFITVNLRTFRSAV